LRQLVGYNYISYNNNALETNKLFIFLRKICRKFKSGNENLHYVLEIVLKAFITFNMAKLLHKVLRFSIWIGFSINMLIISMN